MQAAMNRSDRAKQFMPFDALTGLRAALKRKEAEHEALPRPDHGEETAEKINAVLNAVNRGDRVRVVSYVSGAAVETVGEVEATDTVSKRLKLKNLSVAFADIYDISIV